MSDHPDTRRWADAAEHVATYRRTDGAVGHIWHDRPHLLLSTTGRRSGREHTVPLVYAWLPARPAGPDDDRDPVRRLVVVASAGGSEQHPAWYLNLQACPEVGVQLLERRWRTTAVTASGADEELGWQQMVRTWDGFAAYRRDTRRRIPVVVLQSHD